jgi:hypothetical protein
LRDARRAVRRRNFISLLAIAAMSPLAARAQQQRQMRRIGILTSSDESDPEAESLVTAFREELGKLGWRMRSTYEAARRSHWRTSSSNKRRFF